VGLDTTFEIAEPEPAASSAAVTSLENLKQEALDNRAELKSRAMEEQMAAGEVDYKKGAFWPRLGYEAAWVRMQQDPEPLMDESKYFSAYVAFDLFDGGLRRAQVSEARARQKQAQLALKDEQRSIAIEVEQAWRDWHTQQSLIASFESQLRYAGENYDAVIRLFENGMANSVDVMDANTLLVTAERQLSEARYNTRLSLLSMDRATGVFLNRIENRLADTPEIHTETIQP
jgi:outer membrane protein